MSNIRNFHVVRGKSEAEADLAKKIRKHRFQSLLRGLLVLAAVAGVAVILITSYKNQVFSGYVMTQQAEFMVIDNVSCVENNGNIIRYSKDGISNTDAKGEVVWNLTYEMQDPIVRVADGYVAVGDYNGHIIHLVDAKGAAYQIDTKLPMRDFSVSSSGVVAVILEDAGNFSLF